MIEKRAIEGRWWPQGKPNAALYGLLHFDPDAGVTLEIKEARTRSTAEFFSDRIDQGESQDGQTIIGRDEHDRPVTLFFCSRSGSQSRAGLRVTQYHVGYALLGREFASWQDVRFSSVRLNFTFLNFWLGFNPFDKHRFEDEVAYVGYKYPDDLIYRVQKGVQLRLCAEASTRHDIADEQSLTLAEKRVFELRWTTSVSMKEAERWVRTLQRFLSLAMGTPIYLKSLQVFMKNHSLKRGKRHIPIPIEVLRSNSDALDGKDRVSPNNWLFPFKDVKKRFGKVFKAWLEYTEKLEAVIDLYFAVIFNKDLYINHKFLFLAQALERYHAVQIGGYREPPLEFANRLREIRGLLGDVHWEFLENKLNCGNEKTLFERLTELLDARSGIVKDVRDQFPNFAALVRNTRNYYTHFDPKLKAKGKIADGVNLILLVDCMRYFLEVLFLNDLGLGVVVMPAWKKTRRIVQYE